MIEIKSKRFQGNLFPHLDDRLKGPVGRISDWRSCQAFSPVLKHILLALVLHICFVIGAPLGGPTGRLLGSLIRTCRYSFTLLGGEIHNCVNNLPKVAISLITDGMTVARTLNFMAVSSSTLTTAPQRPLSKLSEMSKIN